MQNTDGGRSDQPAVAWQEWGPAAFARAEREQKPVLLHIGAVWCHWCHVMDRTTYRDPQVISLVNNRFVPVRVDNDRRPDVNRRYNMGGWPTTAFLTPTGRVLTGATYVPPREMLRLSQTVLDFWRDKQKEVNIDPFRPVEAAPDGEAHEEGDEEGHEEAYGDLGPGLLDRLSAAVVRDFDSRYGGFGRQPKFPQAASLQLALDRWLRTEDDQYREVVDKTLRAMAGGGMYDPVEGGFFRYSTTRDWSVPHFEKMLEDNARLLDLYLRAAVAMDDAAFKATAGDVLRFWQTVLRNPGTPFLAGSQDADEEYYGLGLEERRRRSAPFVDRTVYTDWKALAVRALLRAGAVLEQPEFTAWGVELAQAMDRDLRAADGGMAHFRPWRARSFTERAAGGAAGRADAGAAAGSGSFTGPAELPGLLGDQSEMLRALLAVYSVTHEAWAFQRAAELAAFMESHLAATAGAFYDGPADPGALGALKLRVTPMEENAAAAAALLELYQLTGRAGYEEQARRTLAATSGDLDQFGSHGAIFGVALDALLNPLHVVVVGPMGDDRTEALLAEARRAPLSAVSVSLQDTAGPNPHEPEATYPAGPLPQAFVCSGATCFAPVTDPESLRESLAGAAQSLATAARSLKSPTAGGLLPGQLDNRSTPTKDSVGPK